MRKNSAVPPSHGGWPAWYDGKNINEVLFCEEFLAAHPMKCIRGRLFTVDGAVEDEAVVTSGGYERYFEEDGRTYIHIIDPRTGYPVENDLLSVTIVSPDGTLADGLSTALYIMGYDKAVQFWEQHQDEFDVILITADEQIHVSKKLQDSFQSDKNWETIE